MFIFSFGNMYCRVLITDELAELTVIKNDTLNSISKI